MTVPQTKLGSAAEATVNFLVGFGVNWTANWLILPMFGFASLTVAANFEIGALYTAISFVRQYALRRFFDGVKFGHQHAAA